MIPVSEGPVETLVMPSDHQNERTHVFALPRELLVSIFKAQSSITDAVHLAGTCHFLRNLYKSEHTIACTVLQREIPCYEEALRLAEAQVPNLQLRHSDALTSKLYLNAKDAARVCRLTSWNFTAKPHVNAITTCRIHGGGGGGGGSPSQREILPHERTRILHSWYSLKLHAESLSPSLGQQHHQSLTQELWAISALQAYVLWSMAVFVCEDMDETAQEELGISNPDPAEDMVDVYAHIQVPAWASTRDIVTDVYVAKRDVGRDEFEGKLNGPCDLCPLPGGAVCEPRERGKTLWEL